MAKSCRWIPKEAEQTFLDAKKELGYNKAWVIARLAVSPTFVSTFQDKLVFDVKGYPTYRSMIKIKQVREYIGYADIIKAEQAKFDPVEDTFNNYEVLLDQAQEFNKTHDDLMATVGYAEDNKITVKVQKRTDENMRSFMEKLAAQRLNKKLLALLEPLGITPGMLTDIEVQAGRVGAVDFSQAKKGAEEIINLIRIANNSEGVHALSEEIAHTLVKALSDNPIIHRAINAMMNEDALRIVLGNEYEDVVAWSRMLSEREGDTRSALSYAAEEAVGKMLQQSLINEQLKQDMPARSLFKRVFAFIKNLFRQFRESDVQKAINESNMLLQNIARDTLNSESLSNIIDLQKLQDDYSLNSLSQRIDRNIEIIRNAQLTEVKRSRITKDTAVRGTANQLAESLKPYVATSEELKTVEGILLYARSSLKEAKRIRDDLMNLNPNEISKQKLFELLRNALGYIQSYGEFIISIDQARTEDKDAPDSLMGTAFTVDGETITVKEVVTSLKTQLDYIASLYKNIAFKAFGEFIEPYLGPNVRRAIEKKIGQPFSTEAFIKASITDVSFMSMWLDAAEYSPDTLLQVMDAVVKQQKDAARMRCIYYIQRIEALRQKAEKTGITDFTWMYQTYKDGGRTGNYITKYNLSQYYRDKRQFYEQLDKKYGVNPTGQAAQEKIAEKNQWRHDHPITRLPSGEIQLGDEYIDQRYENLTDNQKRILSEFLSIKKELDKKYPETRVSTLKAVQRRKSGAERLWQALSSPTSAFEQLKNNLAEDFLILQDDDQLFGDMSVKGLRNFDGSEYMALPVLYTNRLENPNELSDDLFGSLASYAYTTTLYDQMNSVVDALEIGRNLAEMRTISKTAGQKKVQEVIRYAGKTVKKDINVINSNIKSQMDAFFASSVYQRYLKDEGSIKMGDKELSLSKLGSFWLTMSSAAQLGFNFIANMANVATGVAMQNIEMAACEYFSPKDLLGADKEFFTNILSFIVDQGRRAKQNKVSLFFEYFNVKSEFGKNTKKLKRKNLLLRFFGSDILFFGQDAGDKWLYGRTAIAMAKRKKVLYNNQRMSLWDAIKVIQIENTDVYKLNLEDIKELDGTALDVSGFSREIETVNHGLFGIYDEDNTNAANRVFWGKALQQYRKWMKSQYDKRFQAKQTNVLLDKEVEGYYRTLARITRELLKGQVTLAQVWDGEALSLDDKRNLMRCIVELAQFFALAAFVKFFEWPKDKDRPALQRLAELMARRTKHEIGGLAPSLDMGEELSKTLGSPLPSLKVFTGLTRLIGSLMDPWTDWDNELQSGPYEGHSTLYKNFIKAPLPIVAQMYQIMKFDDLDASIEYYMRPSF